jgi:DNA-binding YbaB/EbfC family protein
MGTGFSKRKKEARMLQEQLSKMQTEMENVEVTGTAGQGLVTLKLNGRHELTSLKIKPECVDPEDVEGLEVLIKAAFADASKKLEEQSKQNMGGFPGLEGLPGLPGFSI